MRVRLFKNDYFCVMIQNEEKYMRRALQLALQGRGHVSPNPMVGAVIVDDNGTIVGEGWHRKYGEGHAEVNAVNSVSNKEELRESTIYVTLEPCSHYGKTPPCARLLIDVGVKRVVVGVLDPFPQVSGRGVAMLREAGIEVEVGMLEDECRWLNRRFMKAHSTGLPWVQLKWAETADGYLSAPPEFDENPLRMSSPVTMCLMHRERAVSDAIVVGANTVKADNPSLTTRYWPGGSALRVVLDAHLSMPCESRVLTDGGATVVYNLMKNSKEGKVDYVQLPTCSPEEWLRDLYGRGVTSVMVEGGGNVLAQLLEYDVWDEIRREVSPRMIHGGVSAPVLTIQPQEIEKIGKNEVLIYRREVKKV